uniref:Uncharacterized protein n=1 Tax=Arundo donax TaxID=35708 RepID=A0A0A9A2I9_ARUDO
MYKLVVFSDFQFYDARIMQTHDSC